MDRVVELNRGPFLPAPEPLEPLDSPDGAVVLDVRGEQEFVEGHVPGAVNIPVFGTSFATKAGFLLGLDERIAVHASSDDEIRQAGRGLRSVGFLDLAGYLLDPDASEGIEPVGLEELERLLAKGDVQLLDVREKDERDEGYIPESRHLPYRQARACAVEVFDSAKNLRKILDL